MHERLPLNGKARVSPEWNVRGVIRIKSQEFPQNRLPGVSSELIVNIA